MPHPEAHLAGHPAASAVPLLVGVMSRVVGSVRIVARRQDPRAVRRQPVLRRASCASEEAEVVSEHDDRVDRANLRDTSTAIGELSMPTTS
jgi:hypothetical protein